MKRMMAVVLAALVGFMGCGGGNGDSATSATADPYPLSDITQLSLSDSEIFTGKVTNNSGKECEAIYVYVEGLDQKGTIVASNYDVLADIAPGHVATWKVWVVVGRKVASWKIWAERGVLS